jgi:hypothetical protein
LVDRSGWSGGDGQLNNELRIMKSEW